MVADIKGPKGPWPVVPSNCPCYRFLKPYFFLSKSYISNKVNNEKLNDFNNLVGFFYVSTLLKTTAHTVKQVCPRATKVYNLRTTIPL